MKATARILLFAAVCTAAAKAGPITFTETQVGSGSLDGTAFTNKTVTITLVGNTSSLTNPFGQNYDIAGTATVSVSGVGSDTFSDQIEAFVNQSDDTAGIFDLTLLKDILDTDDPAFATYGLTTAIGPVTDEPYGFPGTTFPTVDGSGFQLTTSLVEGNDSTFTATLAPEPGTLGLLSAGIGVLLLGRRARKK